MKRHLKRCAVAVLLALIAGCASVPLDYPKEESVAIADTSNTRQAKEVAEWLDNRPDVNGFYLLSQGFDAFGARLALMSVAEASIDTQYFLMKPENAGLVFAAKLLEAVDRGVRVRLLIDDIFTTVEDIDLAMLDAHPNIQVRIFNPIARKGIDVLNFIGHFSLANRRMHNKAFIVDNQVAVIGFTPYFIPRKRGIEFIKELRAQGIRIVLLTNSLVTNNHTAVHSHYSSYRKDLLRAGVELWEARADAAKITTPDGQTELDQLTLHTKGILIDGKRIFVGSLNLDPRSLDINTEMGLLIDSPELGGQLMNDAIERIPKIAYRLQLDENDKITWHATIDGEEVVETTEPQTSAGRSTSGLLGKFGYAQSSATWPSQGALRREWRALSNGRNAALARQRGSLRAGPRGSSPVLRSPELALASPTLTCLLDKPRESAECYRTSRMVY
ncbi:MAG: phospholipase D family protein [Gammaproteobacteria bacterium]|nr:phospholipase D family protein [Gammaproteobacteria bacterium]MCP4982035.1 phospholipase D family protein [Gammaproteobacteria bacterium]